MRHARPVRHRGHGAAALGLGEPPGEIGIGQIDDRQGDAERRQDPAEDNVLGQLDDAEAEAGDHDDVEQYVGEQAEEPIPIPRHPPSRPGVARPDLSKDSNAHLPLPSQPSALSAAKTASDRPTQPKMPPCALIMRSPISWNSGKYDPTQSSRTRQSKPRSLASRTVVLTHTSVVTPQTISCRMPRCRRIASRSVA